MRNQKLIYEQSRSIPLGEAPVFITVIAVDEARGFITQESHVFLPREEKYINQIRYLNRGDQEIDNITNDAIRATHRLYSANGIKCVTSGGGKQHHCLSYEITALNEHPFHRFLLEDKFVQQMWEIQEWTASRELKRALAQVTRYRYDQSEAKLMSRMFNANKPSRLPTSRMAFEAGTNLGRFGLRPFA